MKLLLLISILAAVAALAAAIVVALYHHKKTSSGDLRLVGETAEVDKELDPEGTVIVRGELWRAKSINGVNIRAHSRVSVVGFEDHLLLVKASD